MADDKSNTGGGDRALVAGDQRYEVEYFAQRHGISVEQARELIRRHGSDRETLDRAARELTVS